MSVTGKTDDFVVSDRRRTLVVVGNGMVGQRLLELLVERGATAEWDIITFCDEPRLAYDRVALSSLFEGATPDDLALCRPEFFDRVGLKVYVGDAVETIDTDQHEVVSRAGVRVRYDALVLATGSYPFVPPIPGKDAPGCFVYRTVDDLDAIRAYAASHASRAGAVVGGGLLGLEAANALRSLGLDTHVVEFCDRLMPVQLDGPAADALRCRIEDLGVTVHTTTATEQIVRGDEGEVAAMRFKAGEELAVDLVVFSAGIRPRDDLARRAGLAIAERGGVVVDEACRTSAPDVFAIGECAVALGRVWGLVAPGYKMARVVADRVLGGDACFDGADLSTKLKLLGVEVASFGDAFATTEGAEAIAIEDRRNRVYKKLVVGRGGRLLGGMLVGDASAYQTLTQMCRGDLPTPERVERLLVSAGGGEDSAPAQGVGALAGSALICSCNNVTKADICAAIDGGATDVGRVKACTRAGTGCGGCVPLVTTLVRHELTSKGVAVSNDLCEHFPFSRQELFDLVRVRRYQTFAELLAGHGRGRGCEICKPAVASILATLGDRYILDGELATLQDTNDHFLANLQRDGTYSVVPRAPGGEITPDQLIAIGQIAKDFGLYTKITGGQRVDLFGARVDQLPAIWQRLVDAGMESGHAYGKALRTVKSCVGLAWCRYGVQDSTALAVELELRYRGLRSPHKVKAAVSGCSRECAEAQGKDFGVIATEKGWNLYVCGNGGMKPQHGVLLASDIDRETVIRYADRFLMFYIRTADRLERTATWLNRLEGGIDYLRRVVVDDCLGLAAEFEAEMARHVAEYRCEWRATIEDPAQVARFTTFVNDDGLDPNVVFVRERGQHRPAFPHEKPDPGRLITIGGRP